MKESDSMIRLARRASRIPFAPVVAILFGVVAAILMAAVPQWLFERSVVQSGLPTVIAAAAPPLGVLARLLAVVSAFLVIAVVLWGILGPVTTRLENRKRARTPWRDTGYDEPVRDDSDLFVAPRRPIFAPEELGAPLMSDEAVANAVPLTEPDNDIARAIWAHADPLVSPKADTSIAALIARLEEGLARRREPRPDGPDGAGGQPIAPDADVEGEVAVADAPVSDALSPDLQQEAEPPQEAGDPDADKPASRSAFRKAVAAAQKIAQG